MLPRIGVHHGDGDEVMFKSSNSLAAHQQLEAAGRDCLLLLVGQRRGMGGAHNHRE